MFTIASSYLSNYIYSYLSFLVFSHTSCFLLLFSLFLSVSLFIFLYMVCQMPAVLTSENMRQSMRIMWNICRRVVVKITIPVRRGRQMQFEFEAVKWKHFLKSEANIREKIRKEIVPFRANDYLPKLTARLTKNLSSLFRACKIVVSKRGSLRSFLSVNPRRGWGDTARPTPSFSVS